MFSYQGNVNYRMETTKPRNKPHQTINREAYRPAIADLSQQAFWISGADPFDHSITSYDSTERLHDVCTPSSKSATIHEIAEISRPYSETALSSAKVALSLGLHDAENARIPYNPRINIITDDYRERIAKSALRRSKLITQYKRPAFSRPSTTNTPRTIPTRNSTLTDRNGNTVCDQQPSLLVKSCCSPQEHCSHGVENIRYKSSSHSHARPPTRSRTSFGTLLSDGSETHVNGFYQQLVQTHPVINKSINHWVTTGFKVQSLRLKNQNQPLPQKRFPSSVRNRRKLSEHTLVEEFKKIRMDRQSATASDVKSRDSLKSTLLISNIHVPTDRTTDALLSESEDNDDSFDE